MYLMDKNIIPIGMVISLDNKNPNEEFQSFKTHRDMRNYLENCKIIKYGARTLNKALLCYSKNKL